MSQIIDGISGVVYNYAQSCFVNGQIDYAEITNKAFIDGITTPDNSGLYESTVASYYEPNTSTVPGASSLTVNQIPKYLNGWLLGKNNAISQYSLNEGGNLTQDVVNTYSYNSGGEYKIDVYANWVVPYLVRVVIVSKINNTNITSSITTTSSYNNANPHFLPDGFKAITEKTTNVTNFTLLDALLDTYPYVDVGVGDGCPIIKNKTDKYTSYFAVKPGDSITLSVSGIPAHYSPDYSNSNNSYVGYYANYLTKSFGENLSFVKFSKTSSLNGDVYSTTPILINSDKTFIIRVSEDEQTPYTLVYHKGIEPAL